ncbi:diguanylate cyclase, partial [Pseudomonas chlororaphis]|nr:diguanylate cyclase [Pseudomonas chlororaphis]
MPIPIHDPHDSSDRTLKRLPLLKAAVVFISMVCLCLCGLLYLQLAQSYHYDMARAQVASSNLARAMAQQAEDTFVEADLVLASLADWIQKDGYGPAQKPFLQKIFAQRAL